MAGLLCQWLVLEQIAELNHMHIAVGCDNTPTVAWAKRLLSTKAPIAARLLRAPSIRMLACNASPLAPFHIPGKFNTMADIASRSFANHTDNRHFLTFFANKFPLPQGASWIMCQLDKKTTGKLFSTLLTNTLPMASWQRTTNNASVIGGIGETTFGPISTRAFKMWTEKNKSLSFKFSLNGFGAETSDAAFKSAQGPSKMHWQRLERPANWTDTPTLSTKPEQITTISDSHASSKLTAKMTHPPSKN